MPHRRMLSDRGLARQIERELKPKIAKIFKRFFMKIKFKIKNLILITYL